MKAVQFSRYGDADVLELAEVPTPTPVGDEVLIRVRTAGVNPADGKWRAGMFQQARPLRLPQISGYDVAGEVVSGDAMAVGARVAAMVDMSRCGAYAEYAVASVERTAALPAGLDFDVAAAAPTPALTGLQVVEDFLNVQPGQRVLITGALGAVGRFAVRAARGRGGVIAVGVRSGAQADADALGVDEIVVLDGEKYEGAPFDRIVDTVGGAVVAPLCQASASNALICTVSTTPIPAEGIGPEVVFLAVRPNAAQLKRALTWLAAGDVQLPITTLPLSEASAAQGRAEKGGSGKYVLRI